MTKTAKGRATRSAFQDAARRVIARDGYLNARLTDIAVEAGRSVASFYNYFDSKEALLADLAADFNEELQELVAAPYRKGIPPVEALREAIGAFWHHYRQRLPEIVGVFEASMIDPDFAATWQQIRTDGVRTIAVGIRQAQAQGFAPGLDPDLAASALSSMIEHFCYVWQSQGGDVPSVALTDDHAIDTLWTLWSHAIFWTAPVGTAVDGVEPSVERGRDGATTTRRRRTASS
jgi:AcrR family transcriptional regulator